jgi:hypothetical protein
MSSLRKNNDREAKSLVMADEGGRDFMTPADLPVAATKAHEN